MLAHLAQRLPLPVRQCKRTMRRNTTMTDLTWRGTAYQGPYDISLEAPARERTDNLLYRCAKRSLELGGRPESLRDVLGHRLLDDLAQLVRGHISQVTDGR